MNEICIVLYVNALYSQHLLNKPLTNRESNKLMLFPSQLFFSIVENLLRVYAVYYQYGYIIIHQFNKKRIVLQGFKLFPCDGVETTDSFYRLISALPIVIELVSGICKPVRGRSKFPTFLQYLSDLVLLHLYLRMYQQKKNVVVAERECVRADTFHNVKDKFAHLYLQSVAVAADNLLQGFGMQQRGRKPHTAFLFGGKLSVLQVIQKGRYLSFQLLHEIKEITEFLNELSDLAIFKKISQIYKINNKEFVIILTDGVKIKTNRIEENDEVNKEKQNKRYLIAQQLYFNMSKERNIDYIDLRFNDYIIKYLGDNK